MGLDIGDEEINKRVEVIGDATISDGEKKVSGFRKKNFKINNTEWKRSSLDLKNVLYSVIQEMVRRDIILD